MTDEHEDEDMEKATGVPSPRYHYEVACGILDKLRNTGMGLESMKMLIEIATLHVMLAAIPPSQLTPPTEEEDLRP